MNEKPSGKVFNITGLCIPGMHYMVNTEDIFAQAFAEYFAKTVSNRRNTVKELDEGILEDLRTEARTNCDPCRSA